MVTILGSLLCAHLLPEPQGCQAVGIDEVRCSSGWRAFPDSGLATRKCVGALDNLLKCHRGYDNTASFFTRACRASHLFGSNIVPSGLPFGVALQCRRDADRRAADVIRAVANGRSTNLGCKRCSALKSMRGPASSNYRQLDSKHLQIRTRVVGGSRDGPGFPSCRLSHILGLADFRVPARRKPGLLFLHA